MVAQITKDSICKNCVSRLYVRGTYEETLRFASDNNPEVKKSEKLACSQCKKQVVDDPDCYNITECSEFKKIKEMK